MNKKILFLMSGVLTGIVFISTLFDPESGTLFGSVWFFRAGWLIMSVSSLYNYVKVKKSEKESK